jgi:hypothetical protein
VTADQVHEEWEEAAADPDPERDLGYEMMELEMFEPDDGSERFMFLPSNKEMITDDAFILASESAIRDVTEQA